jgi:hypothetical protein
MWRILGWLFVISGALRALEEALNFLEGDPPGPLVGAAMAAFLIVGGLLLLSRARGPLDPARLPRGEAEPSAPPYDRELAFRAALLIEAARRRGGRIRPDEAARDTGLPVELAAGELARLTRAGAFSAEPSGLYSLRSAGATPNSSDALRV